MNDLIFKPLEMYNTCFNPKSSNVVATELTKERLLVNGFVHDEKSYLLGGITGHAGLFSNVLDLSKLSKKNNIAFYEIDERLSKIEGNYMITTKDSEIIAITEIEPSQIGSLIKEME